MPPKDKEIRAFQVSLVRNMGLKRDNSKGSFILSVIEGAEEFYRVVLQDLRQWKAAPPKLKPKEAPDVVEEAPPNVEEAITDAREEAAEAASPAS